MITVHGFGPYFGLADGSPFVIKTMVQLQLAGLPYEHRASGVTKAPRGKVPYIEDEGKIVADSSLIRDHIERKYDIDLDAPLSSKERAIAWSLEKMVEEHLYFALVDLRWRDGKNFAAGPAHFFDRLPAPVRPLVRRIARARMRKTLHLQGTSRLSRAEVETNARKDIDAIAVQLGDSSYIMGDDATAVDGSVYGVLASLLVPVFETSLSGCIQHHSNLVAYVDRMSRRFSLKHCE